MCRMLSAISSNQRSVGARSSSMDFKVADNKTIGEIIESIQVGMLTTVVTGSWVEVFF